MNFNSVIRAVTAAQNQIIPTNRNERLQTILKKKNPKLPQCRSLRDKDHINMSDTWEEIRRHSSAAAWTFRSEVLSVLLDMKRHKPGYETPLISDHNNIKPSPSVGRHLVMKVFFFFTPMKTVFNPFAVKIKQTFVLFVTFCSSDLIHVPSVADRTGVFPTDH